MNSNVNAAEEAVNIKKAPRRRKNKPFIRETAGDKIFNVVNISVFTIITIVCIFPFYYLFINTISDNALSAQGAVILIPKHIHFSNYIKVFELTGLGHAAIVSLARTVIGSVLCVIGSALLGFVFSQKYMWGRKFWYRFVVITMYFNAGLIPWFIIMFKMHLTNNYLAYILPYIVSPFNVILVKTFIESLPASIQESAEIDGAGPLRIFWKIILPLTTPILATIAVFSAVGQWNQFTDTLFLMTRDKYYTLQFILYRYMNTSSMLARILQTSQGGTIGQDLMHAQTSTSVKMTVSMIIVTPILFVYPFFQRYFVKGIMLGAVKG